MISAIQASISSYVNAFQFIHRHHLWNYLLISGLISLSISILIFGGSVLIGLNSSNLIMELYPFEWGERFIAKLGEWVVMILLLLGSLFILKYVIIIALGPLLSLLSEKIEAIECGDGHSSSFTLSQFFKDFVRGLRINLRNVWKELLFTILLLLISIVPGAALITGPALILLQAYYAGFGNFDLYLERHLNYKQSVVFVRQHKYQSTSNGLVFLAILSIPVLGWVLAPFLGVVAASLVLNKENI